MAHRQGRRNDHHAGQSSAGPESPRTFQDASGPGQIDIPKPKLDIGNTVPPGILRSFFNHLRGHVHTDDLSFPSYTVGGKEAVEARPTAQIENGLAGLEGCQGERISAAEPPLSGWQIIVLGPGCARCTQLEKDAREALAELALPGELIHVDDLREIARYGVMGAPALIINGKVVSVGTTPRKEEINF